MPHPDLEEILSTDISTHLYELHSTAPSQDLGIQQRTTTINISINDTDYEFTQSLTSLNSTGSTTGFVLWRVSIPFITWAIESKLYDFQGKYVVELGAGVTGLFSSVLGPRCGRYIATDQRGLLKLLKRNIGENLVDVDTSTMEGVVNQRSRKSSNVRAVVDVVEFDWEDPQSGMYSLQQLTSDSPDFIIGCDIVYNDYLVPHLCNSLQLLCGQHTTILIGLQVRLPENIELFVESMLSRGFKVYRHPESLLSNELNQGFVIYYIHR